MDCDPLFATSDDEVFPLEHPSGVAGRKAPVQRDPCNLTTPTIATPSFQFGMSVQPSSIRYPYAYPDPRMIYQSYPDNPSAEFLVVRNNPGVASAMYPATPLPLPLPLPLPRIPNHRLVQEVSSRYQPKSDAHYYPPINDYSPPHDEETDYTSRAFADTEGPDPWMNQSPRRIRSGNEYEPFPDGGRRRVHPLPYHNENILNLSNNSRLRDAAAAAAGDYAGPSNYTNYLHRPQVPKAGTSGAAVDNSIVTLFPPIEVSSGEEDDRCLTPRKRVLREQNKKMAARIKKMERLSTPSNPLDGADLQVKVEKIESNVSSPAHNGSANNIKQEPCTASAVCNNRWKPNVCKRHPPHDRRKSSELSYACPNATDDLPCQEIPCKCQRCFPSLPSAMRNPRVSYAMVDSEGPGAISSHIEPQIVHDEEYAPIVKQELSHSRDSCKGKCLAVHRCGSHTDQIQVPVPLEPCANMCSGRLSQPSTSTLQGVVPGTSKQSIVLPANSNAHQENQVNNNMLSNISDNHVYKLEPVHIKLERADGIVADVKQEQSSYIPAEAIAGPSATSVKRETGTPASPHHFCTKCQGPELGLPPLNSIKTEEHQEVARRSERMDVDVKQEMESDAMPSTSQAARVKEESPKLASDNSPASSESHQVDATPSTSRGPGTLPALTCLGRCCENVSIMLYLHTYKYILCCNNVFLIFYLIILLH